MMTKINSYVLSWLPLVDINSKRERDEAQKYQGEERCEFNCLVSNGCAVATGC